MPEETRVWSIGEESELFAAHSEQEVRIYYTELVGKGAEEALKTHFEEMTNLDEEREFYCDGEIKRLSYRRLIEMNGPAPAQISTSYN